MAWIESHQSLRNHPKVKKAALLAGVSEVYLVGHLQYLWWWCLDYADDGDVSDFDEFDLELAMGWEGEPGKLYQALVNCGPGSRPGFLDIDGENVYVHDWYEYAGKLVERREKNKERMKKSRAKNVQGTCDARVELPTQPTNTTNQPTNQHPLDTDFGAFYGAWLNKTTRADSSGNDGVSLQVIFDDWRTKVPHDELIAAIGIAAKAKGQSATPSYLEGILRKRQSNSTNGDGALFEVTS